MKRLTVTAILLIIMCLLFFVFIPLTLPMFLAIVFTVFLMVLGIFKASQILSLFGLCCYYLTTIYLLPMITFDDPFSVYVQVPLFVVPSIIFLNQILQLSDTSTDLSYKKLNWAPLLFSISLFLIVIILFLMIGYFIGHDSFFSTESMQAQILLLTAFSMLVLIPFLLKPIKKTLEPEVK
jgi:hypothetical protein